MNVDNCTIDFEYLGSAGATIVPAVNEQFVRWREAFKIFLMDKVDLDVLKGFIFLFSYVLRNNVSSWFLPDQYGDDVKF